MKSPPSRLTLVALTACGAMVGCRKEARPAPEPAAPAPPPSPSAPPLSPSPPPSAALAPVASGASAPEAEVAAVYPETGQTADPGAAALCHALHDVPDTRRAACCKQPRSASSLAGECTRQLTAALVSGALAIDADAARRCTSAIERQHDGCDWVGTTPPPPPVECGEVTRGQRAVGALCRSSLECATGLRCHGVGPTEPGTCGTPLADGLICGAAVDTLAVFLRQRSVDRRHPECAGFCLQHRCRSASTLGQPCVSNVACAPDSHCDGVRCVAGANAALDGPCADGGCIAGQLCIGHRCIVPRRAGEACTSDVECLGRCDAARGSCVVSCGAGTVELRSAPRKLVSPQ